MISSSHIKRKRNCRGRFFRTAWDYTKTGNGFCDDNDGVYTGDRNPYCIRNCQGYERKYVSYASLHNIGMTYLKGLGVKDSTLCDLSGGDRSDESSSNG